MNIRRDALEARVLNSLRTRLVDPDLFAEFCDAYTRETSRLRMESGAGIDKAEAELKRISREEEKLMDLYMRDAISIEAVKERGDKLRPQGGAAGLPRHVRRAPAPAASVDGAVNRR
ncbi:hypothetical protein OC539_21645 [Paracoccus denitrificans]|jgi:hypothetical protein|uniref:Uncharacterized protein n=1 Tax=Paracoccus denitrificans (strain Pd 1222) TaxID=318586 RepID=A1B766_PARDP|nr:hypothetical protein [Paracoccus denitrificans]ABL71360.1 hypothetical protein Pden_3282 [Paracoccus denitrificans PD1222]MBB4629539.1 hypothetical protein [Paracoccus denitrificans]MCU7430930.1 hypothetical protein [Paracoccus denitrificans]UPV97705.1 hypothetical protein M0K93_16760 [Paracoccus denitrificans]WQO35619.1 hypothetical protein U0005_22645 [Paracoccus denitrificans]